jgi:hypothetical protein
VVVKLTFVEIYMEELKDLLGGMDSDQSDEDINSKPSANNGSSGISIRETKDGDVRLVGAAVRATPTLAHHLLDGCQVSYS